MLSVDHVPSALDVVLRVHKVRAAIIEVVLDVPEHPPLDRRAGQLVLVHHPVRHPVVALVLEQKLRARPRVQGVRAAGHAGFLRCNRSSGACGWTLLFSVRHLW